MADFNTAEIVYISPETLTDRALACKAAGNIGVAFTYNEPLVGWEYIRDTGTLVIKAGMKNVLVTNGTASIETLEEDSAACHPIFPKVPYDGQGGNGDGKSVRACGNCQEIFRACVCRKLLNLIKENTLLQSRK